MRKGLWMGKGERSPIIFTLPLVRSFQHAYPGVVVHCQVTERFIDHIADGVDLSLRVGQPKDSNLIATTVSVHRPRLVASPPYLATLSRHNCTTHAPR